MSKPLSLNSMLGMRDSVKLAYYEGAKKSRLNRDFAVKNGHFETIAGADRDLMRARARWLAENNPICSSIDDSLVKNIVGTGIELQSKIKDKASLNSEIEERWWDFCSGGKCDAGGNATMFEIQEMILRHDQTDGEIFIQNIWTNDEEYPYKIQLIEADRIDAGKNDGKELFYGVKTDKRGKPLSYFIYTDSTNSTSKEIMADEIIHCYQKRRATQKRGISSYSRVINSLKDLAAYNDAVITKERVSASLALLITTTDIEGHSEGNPQEGNDRIREITAGMVEYLRPGEDIRTLQPTNVGVTYPNFIASVVRLIAAGRDISYELAMRDYSQVNYSSARASLLQDFRTFDRHQSRLFAVMDTIYGYWLDSQVMAGNIKISGYEKNKAQYLKPFWVKPKREWTDPIKEINANKIKLDLGVTSRTKLCREMGYEFEDIAAEIVAEELLMQTLREKNKINQGQNQ